MTFQQVITPDPDVPCQPGWCLTYLDDCFNLEAHGKTRNYASAIAAWRASKYQHKDRNFPTGRWVPVYFTLSDNEYGHVALLAPDGTVWSSSHPTSNKPVHHKSLDDLDTYYGRGRLGFLGWTEDLTGILVIKKGDDMEDIITDKHKDLMRVINSEVKGWDRNVVHTGKLDERELKAWKGKKISEFSQQAWNEGIGYRELKDKWKAAYDAQPGLLKKIDDLSAQLKAMPQDTSEAEAELQALSKALKDVMDIK